MAARVTGDREALARAIEHMRPDIEGIALDESTAGDLTARATSLELYSLDMQLRSRVNRMRDPFEHKEPGGGWVQFAVTLAAVTVSQTAASPGQQQ